ncbi:MULTISPECIES: hypothetical protein [Streptomyces]|uniref:Uncharacterized protein n=1 Tax=Streptomyces fradiae ATCC 10745 = DSM 40063 TaxID=1319510 RepID=A0A1Y2NUD4_STRFR|nr:MULTISPECIES: hypothetical protein [Streptomyces]KAF0646864.1 hypothetical protein K701_26565 [Streptomyces fradiae ATCC 10745 = DSM 40063]OSY49645.1 hypothetical protein BG846_04785 [Streptomyces fradiae ATCC 10745 = DSM 40063]OSY51106.1 hypothetical protein BG846_03204 [Streptomyces fradiae ATCC 10745 = DSM 40063]OSY51188.1 hypothetical protein BG846_03170 [Streptomyces fradiae ATCC 10745 = DSM 40063]QEV10687.1 hypothetical protein CP974_00110 [Streptomyces fradiae ATCC 10745 = DSM 40063]
MQPEHRPFHRCEDTCAATARLLVQADPLDPAPHAPAAGAASVHVPPVTPRPVTLALIAEHVNAWGRVVIDPTLPHADVTAPEERSLRYTLQALWEAAGEATRGSIRSTDGAAADWWRVNCALQEAQAAAHRTTLASSDGAQADLWWYIALLHLGHARTLWKDRIGHTLPQ